MPVSVFESFTDRARRVLVLAQEEVRLLNHNFIGTEHILLGLVHEGEGVAVQVRTTLGADVVRLRQQVIALLDGQLSSEAAEAGGVSVETTRDGPRCPTCRCLLAGRVGYRVLAVSPVEEPEPFEVVDVMFVYRLCCGVMLAHTSAREIGLSSTPQAGAFAGVDQATTPAQPERVIADGATDDGVRWTLTARGDDENYVTMLRTEDSAGVIDNGGMGGPKLWGSTC